MMNGVRCLSMERRMVGLVEEGGSVCTRDLF
jgi:hypothetical protein